MNLISKELNSFRFFIFILSNPFYTIDVCIVAVFLCSRNVDAVLGLTVFGFVDCLMLYWI